MNLYLLTQNENNDYDTYDSCVVCAANESDARIIHPDGDPKCWNQDYRRYGGTWASSPDNVDVKFIGVADDSIKPNSVVIASFNAG